MNILFAVTHPGFLRNFESTLALLADQGHRIHLATDRREVADVIDGAPILDRLIARRPDAFTVEAIRSSKRNTWYAFATLVRAALDYWRYLAPRFDHAPALRARGRQNAPRAVRWLSDMPGAQSPRGLAWLTRAFESLERLIPPRPEVEALFDSFPADVLFVTPLLYFGSQQVDYVRCAKRRGIPSVLGVGSWDHLTTKGLIHEMPDRILVWNENQKREAIELHDARPEQITVTGAQAYDHWFATRPATTREEFCARVGLPADRPYVLYLCSSPFIAPREVEFVEAWVRAVRASSSPTLRTAGILVRPHPQNAAQWANADLSPHGDAVIWPRAGANPIRLEARSEYYDSMYHCHAVVGVNTSALIESGIVGRLVYSIRADQFAGTQEGTLHFQHLKNGGLLRMADSVEAHVAQLEASFVSADRDREQIRGFIQSFVRPHGLDRPATPQLVAAAEELGRTRLTPRRLPAGMRAMQVVLGAALALVVIPLHTITILANPEKRGWFLRTRSYALWRHATRPFRLFGRSIRSVTVRGSRAIAASGSRVGGSARRRIVRLPGRLARGAMRLPGRSLRMIRRAVLRTRFRLGEVKRRIWSSDQAA